MNWKRPWCWERLKAGGEGDVRGWDGWMASPTQWTWVWINPGSWWWTERSGVLQSMGSHSQTWLSDRTELHWPIPDSEEGHHPNPMILPMKTLWLESPLKWTCESLTMPKGNEILLILVFKYWHAWVLSHFSCVWLSATLWITACQAPLSMGFFRQEYWSGLPCPSPVDLSNSGIEQASLASSALAGRFFTTSTIWEGL